MRFTSVLTRRFSLTLALLAGLGGGLRAEFLSIAEDGRSFGLAFLEGYGDPDPEGRWSAREEAAAVSPRWVWQAFDLGPPPARDPRPENSRLESASPAAIDALDAGPAAPRSGPGLPQDMAVLLTRAAPEEDSDRFLAHNDQGRPVLLRSSIYHPPRATT